MKIRSRVLLNTALVALMVGVAFMLIIYFVLRANLEEKAYKNLTSHLNLFAANLDEHFNSSAKQLHNIAANTALFKEKRETLSANLKDLNGLIMEFKSISYLGLDGVVKASSNSKLIGKKLNQDTFGIKSEFEKVMSDKKGQVIISPIKHLPSLFKLTGNTFDQEMMVPVFDDNGKRIGILSAFFDVDLIADHLNFLERTIGKKSEVYLLDNEGLEIVSSNKKLKFLTSFKDTSVNRIKKMIGKKGTGDSVFRDPSGRKILMGFGWLSNDDNTKVAHWILVVKEPYSKVTEPIYALFSNLLIAFVIAIILIGGLAIIDTHYLTRPLRLLVLANELLAGGNFKKIKYDKKNEVGDVARAFNHAVEKIQKTTKELTENEELFRTLANSTSAGILIIQDAKIVYVNRAATKIFGYGAEEFYKINFWDIAHPDYMEIIRDYGLGRQQGKDVPSQYEFKAYSKDGAEKWISMSAGSMMWKGKIASIGTAIDYTQRKYAEEKLRFDEQRLRQAQRMGKIGFLDWDLKSDIIEVSPEVNEFLKFGEDRARYKFKEITDMIHPDDVEYVIRQVFDARDGKATLDIQYRIKPFSGSELYVWSTGEIIFDEKGNAVRFLGTMQDITESKQKEEALKLFRVLINGASDAIEVVDPGTGRYLDVNEKGYLDLGYSREEFLNLTIADIDPTVEAGNVEEIMAEIKKTGSMRWEGTHRRKDGSTFPVEVNLQMIEFDSEYIVSVVRDITERKRIEKELVEAKEKAEESERLKTAFLANMSHEIRTPMNGILGFTELLKEPDISKDEMGKYIGIIEKSGQRMLSTVNDIIDISKIESGQMTVSISETNVNEQMEFVHNFFQPEVEMKGLKIHLKTGLPNNKSSIKTDREKFYGILTNLVKNAIKFTHDGFIELGYEKKDKFLEFYVKDTGTGIPGEQQESVFSRFIQGSTSLTRNYEGSGLGLTITKAYVEMLGGKIWVKSNFRDPSLKELKLEETTGSTFSFTLPYNNIKMGKNASEGSQAERGKFDKKLNILVVEDDEVSEQLIVKVMEPVASELSVSRNGLDAVEKCRNNPNIDLVLMDIKIPGLDGYEATKEIRKFNTKVIIVAETAFALTGDREKALEAGCNDYLPKPIKMDVLNKILEKHFG